MTEPVANASSDFERKSDQIMTRVSEGRFDENLTMIVREIMDETLVNLDWWAGQIWWFLPAGFEPSPWRINPNAPAVLNSLATTKRENVVFEKPTNLYREPTLVSIEDADWLPTASDLKSVGVRQLVVLDIVADNRPSTRLIFIVPSASSLGVQERQFLAASGVLLPKMVIRERVRTELHFRATHDPLTGLLNRLGLNQMLQMAPATRKNLRAVLFLDINKFKAVNDQFGHPIGDELLIHVANQLSAQIRPTDAIARIGGDEFVVVAGEVASPAGAEILAKRLWDSVSKPFTFSNGSTWTGSASIGVAIWQPGETYFETLRHADTLMYRAKKTTGGIATQENYADKASECSLAEMVKAEKIGANATSNFNGVLVSIDALVGHPETKTLADFILTKSQLHSDETGHISIWLKLPKSYWLDEERISVLISELQNCKGKKLDVSLVLPCASASQETRLIARELIDRHKTNIVLDEFGSGNRDLELLSLMKPVALIIDALALSPEEAGPSENSEFDWAIARSVIAIARELEISAVAPIEASASELDHLKNLGCHLWLQPE